MNELLLAALLSGTTPPTCTMELRSLFDRAERANYLVARATADSLSDGDYYHNIGRSGFGRAPGYAGQRANRVFGQVFELEITAGHLADTVSRHRRVLVVWWEVDSGCGRWVPRRSRRVAEGTVFLLKAPREPIDWHSGMPTYDFDVGDFAFPWARLGSEGPQASHPDMPMREFLEMLPLLPDSGSLARDPGEALGPRLRWAAADPSRAERRPAREILCRARQFLGEFGTGCVP